MRKRIRHLLAGATLSGLLLLGCPLKDLAEALAEVCDGTLEVTTTAEDVDPSKPDAFHVCGAACSLRDAIATANACDAPQTVLLAEGTYVLTAPDARSAHTGAASASEDARVGPVGLPRITGDVTILGMGEDTLITRESDDPFRLFHVQPQGRLVLDRVVATGGATLPWPGDPADAGPRQDGGGIYNEGELVLRESELRDHHASRNGGGIATLGPLAGYRSRLLENSAQGHLGSASDDGGGALYIGPAAKADLQETELSRNRALGPHGHGGAILNRGELWLTASLLADNEAWMHGGAIDATGFATTLWASTLARNESGLDGGAIHVEASTHDLLILSSTLSGNAGLVGGAFEFDAAGDVDVIDSTIAFNESSFAGVVVSGGAGEFSNNVIAHNPSVSGGSPGYGTSTTEWNCRLDAPVLAFDGLDTDGSCNGYRTVDDAGLEPLADNGGPTPTHDLAWWSPAVDAGNACEPRDQRFFPRPVDADGDGDARCDAGALEREPITGAERWGDLLEPEPYPWEPVPGY